MIDHILGKPSSNWKRTQVILVALFSLLYLKKQPAAGPRYFRKWNAKLQKYTPWQILCGTLTVTYLFRNAFLLLGLNAPEPLARLYSRNYYRATWILTALDAGFWTALPIKPKFLRDIFALVFTLYYAIFADQAEEKVRKIRSLITVPHMRASWEKSLNPYLYFLTSLLVRKRLGTRKQFYIPRPAYKPHASEPIEAYLYYCGSEQELEHCDELVLDFPGGGFVTMSPACHDDYLSFWATQTRCPVLSINYGKAPEFPYPWAIEECFDAYRTIIDTNGECIGVRLGPERKLKIILVGDSAGGNIAAAVMYKILDHDRHIPSPSGIVLVYPCLDFNITSWMPPEQLQLIRAASMWNLPGIMDSKNHLSHKSPLAVVPDKQHRFRTYLNTNIEDTITHRGKGCTLPAGREFRTPEEQRRPSSTAPAAAVAGKAFSRTATAVGTRLAMTSRMSFFEDRLITPDMMRAMAILYIGPNAAPDFAKDYYLSPIVGPDRLLERFPPVFMICGEKDPFVDDTVVFAGRIRNAKRNAWKRNRGSLLRKLPSVCESPSKEEEDGGITFQAKGSRQPASSEQKGVTPAPPGDDGQDDSEEFNESDHCTVKILEGMSHAFMQMLAFLPEAKGAVRMVGNWIVDNLEDSDQGHRCHYRNDVPVRTVSHKEVAELGRMADADGEKALNRTVSRLSPAAAAPPAASSASSASTSVSPNPSGSADRGKAVVGPGAAGGQSGSGGGGDARRSLQPPEGPQAAGAGTPPPSSGRSPRAARRRAAAVKEKPNPPDLLASGSSSFTSAHEEWERKNVIASERELLDRRRGDFDRYFVGPECGGTPPAHPTAKSHAPPEPDTAGGSGPRPDGLGIPEEHRT